MSLARQRPIFTMGDPKGDFMLQRFCWKGETQFTHQFTLALKRNNEIPRCDENKALDTEELLTFLRKGRRLSDKVMIRRGYNLNTFTEWSRSGITRFTLRTIAPKTCPELIVDDDPSTIRYHSVSEFQRQFNNLHTFPLIKDSDTIHVCYLGSYRHVSLDNIREGSYVRKTIDDGRPETLTDWRNEFVLLNRLQECPYTIDLMGLC
jgi:hypothetical protein